MASVATYLNLPGQTEEAFEFYKSVFGTEYAGQGIMKMGDVPQEQGDPPLSDEQKNAVMHVSLPILGGHLLMGTDVPDVKMGNNVQIMLSPDSREEADELFAKLSAGGTVLSPMADMFWGDYWGALRDKFGIEWMLDIESAPS
jgi:PhnB protein